MRTRLGSAWVILSCWVAGCSFVADFDRSKIEDAVRDAGIDAAGMDAAAFDASQYDAAGFLKDGSSDAMTTDADVDAQVDAGEDSGSDAGMDAAMDSGMDAEVDAGEDASVDAGEDAAVDAGADAEVDAGEDAGEDAGIDAGPQCFVPADCGSNGACFVRTCSLGMCGLINLSNGANALTGQTAGNCKKLVCDGAGGFSEVNDNTDVFDDGKQCTTDTCSNGSPVNTPMTPGASCSQSGGTVCSAAGDCVQCLIADDCGDDTDCVTFSCTGSFTCQQNNTAAGTPTISNPPQVAGDCREIRCNGTGGTTLANLDADLPDDDKECTIDTCDTGSTVFTPRTPGTSCTQDGGTSCNAAGDCVGCIEDEDCGADNDCADYTCNMGTCEVEFTTSGTGTVSDPPQVSGDCLELQCDGDETPSAVPDDADLPNDSKECTVDSCNMGMTVFTPMTLGELCSQDGGTYCDASGDCVECISDSDCGTDNDCADYTCNTGTCEVSFTASGTATVTDPPQVAGDCLELQCDGDAVPSAVPDDADVPNDNNVCTEGVCNMGTGSQQDVDAGDACDDGLGGAVCDGSGTCVECLDGSHCGSNICVDQACITAGMLSSGQSMQTDGAAGAANTITLNVTTSNPWPADGTLTIVFHTGYDLTAAVLQSLSGPSGGADLEVNGQEILLTRTSGATYAAGVIQVELSGIVNPGVSGTAADFEIATRTASGVSIDDGTAPGLEITPGALTSTSAMLAPTTVSQPSAVTVSFTLSNAWPADGRLDIALPPELDATMASLQSITGPAGTFLLNRVGNTMQITHDSGAAVTNGGTMFEVVLADLVNPSTDGDTSDYTVSTLDGSAAVIDTATLPGSTITP